MMDNESLKSARMKEIWPVFFLIILVAALKSPFLHLPVFWDEQTYMDTSRAIYENGFNPFIKNVYSYRPPFILILGALAFKIFGISIFSLRLVTLGFSCLAVCFTYLIGKELYGRQTGIWAGILLLCSPIFFAQSGLFLESIPVTALSASTIYFYFKDRKISYLISAGLLVLTREIGALVVMVIALFEFFSCCLRLFAVSKENAFLEKMKAIGILKALFYTSPLVFFSLWLVANKIIFGWFIWPQNSQSFAHFGMSLGDLKVIIGNAFGMHFRYLASLAIILGLLFSLFSPTHRKRFLRKEFFFFLLLSCATIIFYAWVEFTRDTYGTYSVLPRYYLFLQVLFFVFGAAAIVDIAPNKSIKYGIFVAITGIFVYSWWTLDFKWAGERNLSYCNIVDAHRKTAEFLKNNYPGSPVITTWPIYRDLTEPDLGYVKEPFSKVYDINRGKLNIQQLKDKIDSQLPSEARMPVILVIPANCVPNDDMFAYRSKTGTNMVKEIDLGIEKVWIYSL